MPSSKKSLTLVSAVIENAPYLIFTVFLLLINFCYTYIDMSVSKSQFIQRIRSFNASVLSFSKLS